MSPKKINVAVAGATGVVGNQMVACLEERNFPVRSIRLLASSRSVGRKLAFRGEMIGVEELKEDSFKGVDIAIFPRAEARAAILRRLPRKPGALS